MNVSPTEAEESLAAIQTVAQKTRRSVASGGTYITLIITGVVWLIGFLCTQFLSKGIVGYVWAVLSILGTALGMVLGYQRSRHLRSPAAVPTAKRVGLFWLFLLIFGIAAIAIAHPMEGRQAVMLIILFLMLGQLAMGLLFSFSSVWWVFPITALALVGYFLLPDIFYLWMAILGGGGMIFLGLYIHFRW